MIYDQLMKLAISDSLTGDLKRKIARECSSACASDSFKQIDEDTLVSILSFNLLNIAELDLLKACMRWTDGEVARQNAGQANKRAVFKAVKHLIRFGDLSLSDLSSVPEINNYLTAEETDFIFLHLYDQNLPIHIDYRCPRRPNKVQVARAVKDGSVSGKRNATRQLKCFVRFDKAVRISKIETFAINNCDGLKFQVYRDNKFALIDCEIATRSSEKWKSYTIDLNHILEANLKYELRFTFSISESNCGIRDYYYSLGISKVMNLKANEGDVLIEIESDLHHHCIQSINFFGPFD